MFLEILDQCMSTVVTKLPQLEKLPVQKINPEDNFDPDQDSKPKLTKQQRKYQKLRAKEFAIVLERIFASFTFKYNMMKSRRLSRRMRSFVETKIDNINKERMFFYSFKPGYVFPRRDNVIVQLTNKCHLFFYKYFPDYN